MASIPMEVDAQTQAEALVERPTVLSNDGKELTRRFSDENNCDVLDNRRLWSRDEAMDVLAMELIHLHQCSLTLEKTPWQDLDIGKEIVIDDTTCGVKHLGQGVFVQNNTIGIDPDSILRPRTITTVETRKFARMCLNCTAKLVVGTGQPRIGKTRGIMAFTLQELLWRGEAVMRVGYKDNLAYLFLPQTDGSYKVWKETANDWNNSALAAESTMHVLLDPPESPAYERAARCRVIEYCSNNEERHTKNVGKDGKLLITNVPRLDEILCMQSVLWDAEQSPICLETEDGKLSLNQNISSDAERDYELYRRCTLVGCIPGVVFSGKDFLTALIEIKANSQQQCSQTALGHIIHFYKQGKMGANKTMVSAMSRYFLVNAKDQARQFCVVRLNAATSYYVQERLREQLGKLTGSNAFDFEDICALLLQGGTWGGRSFPTRTIVCGANWKHTSTLITALGFGNTTRLVRASNCYPLLDFATKSNEWFNAKVGESSPTIGLSAFVTLMLHLNFAELKGNQLKIKDQVPRISLTLIRNNGVQNYSFDTTLASLYKDAGIVCDQVREVFEDSVDVEFLDTASWSHQLAFNAQMSTVETMLDAYSGAFDEE